MNLLGFIYAGLTAVSAFFFLLDWVGYSLLPRNPVAELVDKTGFVKYVRNQDYTWNNALIGTKFSRLDAASTSDSSAALFEIGSGNYLKLAPGSTVVFGRDQQTLSINFLHGEGLINLADTSAPVEINYKGKKVDEHVSQIKIQRGVKEKPQLEKLEKIETPSEKLDRLAMLDLSGQIIAEKMVLGIPQIMTPEQNSTFQPNRPITLTWENVAPQMRGNETMVSPKSYELVLTDAKTSRQITVIKAIAPKHMFKSLKPGKYSLTIKGLGDKSLQPTTSTPLLFAVAPAVLPRKVASPQPKPVEENLDNSFKFKPVKVGK